MTIRHMTGSVYSKSAFVNRIIKYGGKQYMVSNIRGSNVNYIHYSFTFGLFHVPFSSFTFACFKSAFEGYVVPLRRQSCVSIHLPLH